MDVHDYVEAHRERLLDELFEFIRIPSVSTDPSLAGAVRRAAEHVAGVLDRAGFRADLHETAKHPVVVARGPEVPGAPRVLIYGHYDVQPPEPREGWRSDPFEPSIVDGAIVARGASDDKGQVFAHVKGVEALQAVDGGLPVTVTFLIEGEEEIGSPNLGAFLEEHREALACDVVVISDGAMVAPGTPTVDYGLRGMVYMTLTLRAAGRDLHSGSYGGGVPNVLQVLADTLASLKDARGRIAVDGFYDDVVPLSDEERQRLREAPFSEEEFRRDAGVRATPGEEGFTLIERLWARPTLDVNGVWGGFSGEGSKTVIAAEGGAKISCRLVPDQDPHDVRRKVEAHLRRVLPEGVDMDLKLESVGSPVLTDPDSPAVHAARRALRRVWDRDTVLARSGGSIPVVADVQRVLGADVVLVGLGQEDDRAHAPNEKFGVVNYLNGIRVSAELLRALAERAD